MAFSWRSGTSFHRSLVQLLPEEYDEVAYMIYPVPGGNY